MERIYNLKLGETIGFFNWDITRVPGGWIFVHVKAGSAAFIPYSDDLNPSIAF